MGSSKRRLEADVRLALVPGVGPRTRRTLLNHFGSAEAVLAAAPSELMQLAGVGRKTCQGIANSHRIDAAEELEICRQHGIMIVTDQHPEYPDSLEAVSDAPGLLFRRGSWCDRDGLAVAIVGTRHATHYGRRQAERLAGALARAGLTVVSGLARGIDGAAHRAALLAGGRTVAVLGSGVLNLYPPEHQQLADSIRDAGCLYSELPPRSHPLSGAFPQRNRLISGLSLGVIVVEAPLRSGALITAEHAMEQGREVFAVPGPVDSRTSRGCHRLLREGAKLVESVDDVLEELGPLGVSIGEGEEEIRHPAELQLNDQERRVLETISVSPTQIEEIALASGLPIQRVLATISVLEMKRLIRRLSGTTLARI